ncbi:protein hairy [Biomphalaria pfeifferi]|uniref:Protein hairy n=1 Tax=Biomphalaria pfeifferi TaxID=112525 RepID=A0AAD8C4L0_BIOPF|nr:protein hairy [Biomphalaria pfeifferi]
MDNSPNVCEATSQSHEIDNYRPTHRKGKKLLAEKKRRARINNCLVQIRDLVCEGDNDKDTDLDKMEKAEILEKTLEVLTRLRHDYSGSHSSSSSTISTRKAMAVRYASGFSSCAEESIRYIQSSRLVPTEVKVQLQNHLRAIARRMETVVQNDDSSISTAFLPTACSSSSLSPIDKLLSSENVLSSTLDRMSDNESSSVQSRIVFVPSPTSSSTPALQYNTAHSTTPTSSQQRTGSVPTHESFHVQNSGDRRTSSSSEVEGYFKDYNCRPATDRASSTVYRYEAVTPEFNREPISSTYTFSSELSYPSPILSMTACTPTCGSPVMMHPGFLHASPLISDTPVYSYRVYEPYSSLPTTLIQPVHFMTTPITSSPTISTTEVKQPSTPSSALNLCVKSNEAHQISPETMWRPW